MPYTYGDEDPSKVLTTAAGAGTLDLDAYEAGRNSDPGVANVADGVTYEILGVAKEGSLPTGGTVVQFFGVRAK
jgi:hypothetical protein